MRIIAGAAKGTRLKTPQSGTRPMTGRARESIFSILTAELPDADVLDLFAGSGSLGLESLSRGAGSAVFVERSRNAVRVLQTNIDAVGLGGRVVARDVLTAIGTVGTAFDIVFMDPPYADDDASVSSVLEKTIRVLAPDGVIVVHRQSASTLGLPIGLRLVDERRYGDAVVSFVALGDRNDE